MKHISKLLLIFSVSLLWQACVSTTDENTTGEEPLLDATDPMAADAEVDQTLSDVGGPIEDTAVAEEAGPTEEAQAEDVPTDMDEKVADTVDGQDVESYKLSDNSSTPKASDSEPLEGKSVEEKQPEIDMGVAESSPAPVEESIAQEPTPEPVAMPSQDTTPSMSGGDVLYPVRTGESLSIIAKKTMGSLRAWKKLAAYNNIKNPNRVHVGAILKIPAESHVESFVSKHTRTVTIRRGDTLARIAKRVMGSGKLWKYLWKNNENVISNPHKIEVGTTLSYLGNTRTGGVAQKNKAKSNNPAH